MAFDVSVVADIFKFPWPLFPKYKNSYPVGLRYDIPALAQDMDFTIVLPINNSFELQGFVFSATGYKDGDSFSLRVNDDYVLHNIYTKELGQHKELRPIKKIVSTDTVVFTYHNTTGTSKVIWIDLDLTCKDPVKYQ